MPLLSCADDSTDQLPSLRRLVTVRWAALALMTGLLLLVPPALDVPLPGAPLLAIIGITALLNAIAAWRLKRADSATSVELLSQLLIDIFALSALVFFSGGATNPLVSLLLPPVAIAALTLPVRYVAAVGAIAIAAYSALMFFYVPLAMSDATRATRLHLLGMWLTFAVSALMVAWFAVRMTKLIRQRDAELATAREQALRDERIMAIGTLAAGAAHELGTPLGTMALVAGELACDPQLPDATRAGAERLENSGVQAVDVWLQGVRQRWHALRPQAESRVEVTGSLPAPTVANDPRLEQALLNLLNNAANASARAIDIHLDWTGERILIDIRDLGPGFPPDVLQQGGQASFPPHESGSGIGLMLTRSAIEQLGGRLSLLNPPEGGALARLELNPRT